MSTKHLVDDPTARYESLEAFRKSMRGMSADQAEALWAYFRSAAPADEATDVIAEALRRLVHVCESPDELEARVVQAYGEGMLKRARYLAAELRGADWLRLRRTIDETREPESDTRLGLRDYISVTSKRLSNLVLLFGCTALLVALLFPPFVVPLSAGISTNAGFAFLFDPPRMGNLVAVVNVAFLSLELLVAILVTVTVFFVTLVAESVVARRRRQ